MAPAPKLSDRDVKRIRRRVHAGEHLTDLAREFGVNRKTIRRRLDALERAEADGAGRLAAKRVGRQAAQEKLKLREREGSLAPAAPIAETQRSERAGNREPDPRLEWLDTLTYVLRGSLGCSAGAARRWLATPGRRGRSGRLSRDIRVRVGLAAEHVAEGRSLGARPRAERDGSVVESRVQPRKQRRAAL